MADQGMHALLHDEAGAVTVDWVALVSGTLLLGTMVVYAVFNQGVAALLVEVNDTLGSATLGVSTGVVPNLNMAAAGGASGPDASAKNDPPRDSDDEEHD